MVASRLDEVAFFLIWTICLWATQLLRYTLGFPRLWGARTLDDSSRSTFLFALPTWAEGAGRLVDFGDSLTEYNRTGPPGDPDARATAQDWLAVGDYLRQALWHGAKNDANR